MAEDLAATSDEIAERLESGDPCGASQAASRLRSGVTDAINAGRVPQAYLEELSGIANELEALIPACTEPAPPAPAEEGKGKGKAKGEGKQKDKEEKHEEEEDD